MLDVGIQELIIIFVVALLVFGPKKLPEIGRSLGRGIGELRRALEGVKDAISEEEQTIRRAAVDQASQDEAPRPAEAEDAGEPGTPSEHGGAETGEARTAEDIAEEERSPEEPAPGTAAAPGSADNDRDG